MTSAGSRQHAAGSWQRAAGREIYSTRLCESRDDSRPAVSRHSGCPLPAASCLLFAAVALGLMASAVPAWSQPLSNGRTITAAAPEPKRLILALDEVELDWSGAGDRRAVLARDVTPVAGVRAIQPMGLRTVLKVVAGSEADLAAVSRAAETANPGAEARLVLYEEGEPRSDRTRHLLTREVAILVEPGTDVGALLTQLGVEQARQVTGVPNAWIVLAREPLESLRLVDTASATAGIRLAYPLLRKKPDLR